MSEFQPHELALFDAVRAWAEREYELTGRPPETVRIMTAAGYIELRHQPASAGARFECLFCGRLYAADGYCTHGAQ